MAKSPDREQMVVLRWRTRTGCEALAPALDRAFPPDPVDGFEEALQAIDQAESAVWADCKPADEPPQ